jgi:hypothetical protein
LGTLHASAAISPASQQKPEPEILNVADLLRVIEPLRESPLRLSSYLEAISDVGVADLILAIDEKLLRASYPMGGPEPVIYLLPEGQKRLAAK